jgi:hypothetical protein
VTFNLLDIGRDEQQGALGGTTFGREYSRHGAGMERIHRQAVQRIGWQRDDPIGFDHTRSLAEPARIWTRGTNTDSPHSDQLSMTSQDNLCDARVPPRAAKFAYTLAVFWYYSHKLHATWLGLAIAGNVPWLWPTLETLHFFGMALLVGCVGTLDLRMLGVAKGLPLGPMQRLIPWAVFGFAINMITGIGFYIGNPEQYQTWAFLAKITFIVLAGANALWFYVSGLHRRLAAVGAGQDAPMAAKLVAAGSLVLWLGVMFWGRMLPSFSKAF